jgi:hypothetical protein
VVVVVLVLVEVGREVEEDVCEVGADVEVVDKVVGRTVDVEVVEVDKVVNRVVISGSIQLFGRATRPHKRPTNRIIPSPPHIPPIMTNFDK